jgi:carotenoid cleavage dioxygenase
MRVWDPGIGRHANEAFFVSGGAGEGEGWLLSFVYNRAEGATDLCIFDAQRPDRGPIAEIRTPRVPHGFHGVWIPD